MYNNKLNVIVQKFDFNFKSILNIKMWSFGTKSDIALAQYFHIYCYENERCSLAKQIAQDIYIIDDK